MTERIGIIGGSGVYNLEGIEYYDEVAVDTPFGEPSDKIRLGRFEGRELAFLPRHGRTHRYNPTNVPYAANIYALKTLDVEWIISINACGSLKLEVKPLDFVIPDQVIDRSKHRSSTFFHPAACHISFADPFCDPLRKVLIDATKETGVECHETGTYLCMEGPAFSTRAESELHRSMGASLIGMTAMPEAKFAREAEICYAMVAMSTDYDCWHEEEVDVEMVIANLHKNSDNVKTLIKNAIPKIPVTRENNKCNCSTALKNAVMTQPEDWPGDKKEAFTFLTKKYR